MGIEVPFDHLGLQGLLQTLWRHHVAVLGLQHRHVQTVGLGDFDPALAEFACRADDRLVAA